MMDNNLRQMLADAYALDDRVKRDFELWQAKRQQQTAVKRRSAPGELVHKTFEQPTQPYRSAATMDPATSDAWNKWMTDYVNEYVSTSLDGFADAATEGLAEAFSLFRKELTDKFNTELASLRADMTVQTGIGRGEVSQLKAIVPKRRKDVA
jgi:hypothetical protein